tara:strand:- start:27420 stop:27830 length:411 start_codon:yes stop_codon:yes gene_type:complete
MSKFETLSVTEASVRLIRITTKFDPDTGEALFYPEVIDALEGVDSFPVSFEDENELLRRLLSAALPHCPKLIRDNVVATAKRYAITLRPRRNKRNTKNVSQFWRGPMQGWYLQQHAKFLAAGRKRYLKKHRKSTKP